MAKQPQSNVAATAPPRDADLHATLQKVVTSKHPYVNNTLKRIAKATLKRLTRLDAATQ